MSQTEKRVLLWIDGVGGFLVCLGDEVTFGPPIPGSQVEVPIWADLSRKHASLRREGDSYLLTPRRSVQVNQQPITKAHEVTDGCQIQLGDSVKIRFRRPHPLSTTACLKIESSHRLQPSVDEVILFGQTCILGPQMQHHIVCPNLEGEVVLYRQAGDRLFCKTRQPVQINGVPFAGGGELPPNAQVIGDDFSFTLETL